MSKMKKNLFPHVKPEGREFLSPSPRPRSSLSPTPRSARSHTPIAVRFSDQADSYNYTLSFEESSRRSRSTPDLNNSGTVPTDAGLSYSDTFVSEVTSCNADTTGASPSRSALTRRSLSDQSLYGNSDTRHTTSGTIQYSSSDSRTKVSSYGTSQESFDTVVESQRWLQGDNTSLHTRYDYSETFETSDLSPSEDENSSSTNFLRENIQEREENAKLEFMQNLVKQLKVKDSGKVAVSTALSLTSSPPTKGVKLEPVEVNETESKYCKRKAKLLKAKKKFGLDYKVSKEDPVVKERVSVTEYGFHPSIIDKMKTKSFMAAMEQASKVKIHNPRHCKDCRKHWKTLEEEECEKLFLREKTVKLQRKIMEDKISRHLSNMDSITLIGDIMRSLPKPSDDPEDINRWLNKPLQEHCQLKPLSKTLSHIL